MGVARWLTLLVAAGSALAWAVTKRPGWRPKSVMDLPSDLKNDLEVGAIRWSGGFLHSMGAVDSAPRAQQDALRAQRIAHALTDLLKDGASDVRVMIIGEIVHLEGSVGSDEERAQAERVAREVSGAQVSANDLRVV